MQGDCNHVTPERQIARLVVNRDSQAELRRAVVGLFTALLVLATAVARADEKTVRAALDKPIEVDFRDATFAEIAEQLAKQTGVAVRLDSRLVKDERFIRRENRGLKLRGVSCRAVVSHMQFTLGLDVVPIVHDWGIEIVRREGSEDQRVTRAYDASTFYAAAREAHDDAADELRLVLEDAGMPSPGWREYGGLGELKTQPDNKVTVTQRGDVHERIDDLLRALFAAVRIVDGDEAKKPPERAFRPILLRSVPPVELEIEKVLRQQGEFALAGASLPDMVERLRERYKIPIVLDQRALESDKVSNPSGLREPAKLAKAATLHDYLAAVLGAVDLTAVVWHEALVITTLETAADILTVARIYPVGDFVPTTNREIRRDLMDDLVKRLHSQVGAREDVLADHGVVSVIEVLPTARALYVNTTPEIHAELDAFLTRLRQERDDRPVAVPKTPRVVEQRYAVFENPFGDDIAITPDLLMRLRKVVAEIGGDDAKRSSVELADNRLIVRGTSRVHRTLHKKTAAWGLLLFER